MFGTKNRCLHPEQSNKICCNSNLYNRIIRYIRLVLVQHFNKNRYLEADHMPCSPLIIVNIKFIADDISNTKTAHQSLVFREIVLKSLNIPTSCSLLASTWTF